MKPIRQYYLKVGNANEVGFHENASTDLCLEERRGTVRTNAKIAVVEHKQKIAERFSPDDIQNAQKRISQSMPVVTKLFDQMRNRERPSLNDAHAFIKDLMTSGENVAAISALAKLKNSDEASFLHSLSVSALIIVFARALRLPEPVIHELAMGGLVHDIGKAAIPISILRKRGRLTAGEICIVQKHPACGFEMLKSISGVSDEVLDITLYHHEKIDGTGYPKGLMGEAITINVRIAAICDVYDALTSIRPYKPALSLDESLSMMTAAKGHFDPVLLREFTSLVIESETVF